MTEVKDLNESYLVDWLDFIGQISIEMIHYREIIELIHNQRHEHKCSGTDWRSVFELLFLFANTLD